MRSFLVPLSAILVLPLFIFCSVKKQVINDKEKIEKLLLLHKKHAFIDLYEKIINQEKKKYQLIISDSLFDLTSSELVNEYCLRIDFYSDMHPTYDDVNYNGMINSWLKKEYPVYTVLDNPNIKTTMAFKKVFDFYESDDLANYLDSLRTVFYKKHKNKELGSINCID